MLVVMYLLDCIVIAILECPPSTYKQIQKKTLQLIATASGRSCRRCCRRRHCWHSQGSSMRITAPKTFSGPSGEVEGRDIDESDLVQAQLMCVSMFSLLTKKFKRLRK
jgi:hypothetical protein